MVSVLFTAFALIATGQAETAAAEPTSMENVRASDAASTVRRTGAARSRTSSVRRARGGAAGDDGDVTRR